MTSSLRFVACGIALAGALVSSSAAADGPPPAVAKKLHAIFAKKPKITIVQPQRPHVTLPALPFDPARPVLVKASQGSGYDVCVDVRNGGTAATTPNARVHFEAWVVDLAVWSTPANQDRPIPTLAPGATTRVCTTAQLTGAYPETLGYRDQPRFVAWVEGDPNDGKGIYLEATLLPSVVGAASPPAPLLTLTAPRLYTIDSSVSICATVKNGAPKALEAGVLRVKGTNAGKVFHSATVPVPALAAGATKEICPVIPPVDAYSLWRKMLLSDRGRWVVELSVGGAPNDGSRAVMSTYEWLGRTYDF